MKEALPIIRKAYENSQLRAQYQDGSTFRDFAEVVGKYTNGDPIGLCLPSDVAATLDCYDPNAYWSFGIATFAGEGIIEVAEEELLDFAHLQYYHQNWFRLGEKKYAKAAFERTLWELEDKYEAWSSGSD